MLVAPVFMMVPESMPRMSAMGQAVSVGQASVAVATEKAKGMTGSYNPNQRASD
jgi:hypothetical protein